MVTGLETAGLVLAIFPIAVEGLRFYLKGLESIKRWWRYARAVRELLRTLEMEKVKFEETCEELLYEIVDTRDLDRLLQAPGGPEWQQEDLRTALQDRLGRSFNVYMAAVVEMKTALDTINEKLALDGKREPLYPGHELFKDQWRRVRFSLMAEDNKNILRSMEKHNRDLGVLLGHRKRMASLMTHRSSVHAGKYQSIREDAGRLYRVVSKGLTSHCSCVATHTASLRLEARYLVKYIPGSNSWEGLQDLLFNVLLSFETSPLETQRPPWIWRDTCFEPVRSHSPEVLPADNIATSPIPLLGIPEASKYTAIRSIVHDVTLDKVNRQPSIRCNLKQIVKNRVSFAPMKPPSAPLVTPPAKPETLPEQLVQPMRISQGLCELIVTARDEDSCLGLLASDSDKQHRVSLKRKSLQPDGARFVSLESLLLKRFDIDRKQSLILAIKLASSVLQLHSTPWLNESWGRQDVKFLLNEGKESEALIERPFVSKRIVTLDSESQQQLSGTTLSPGIRNHSLFSLGVVLIELWFGKTLESFCTCNSVNENRQARVAEELATAVHLLDEVYRRAGDWYGDAVRRCLYCDFDQRNTSLEENAMKDSVFQGVVLPLRDHLKALCGGQLDDMALS